MGNWKLEIAKMAIYMAFPVTSFYVYHQVNNEMDYLKRLMSKFKLCEFQDKCRGIEIIACLTG